MKHLITSIFLLTPLFILSQSVNIRWEDSYGREFSLNSHSGSFDYSMVSGDEIKYNGRYDSGPEGTVKSIGSCRIEYNGRYDSGPEGLVKSVCGKSVRYNGRYDAGPEGSVKKIGGMTLYYFGKYESGPEGAYKKSSGSI